MSNTIECEEFRKLMQHYRYVSIQYFNGPTEAYRAVIDFIDKDRANLRDEKSVCLMTISSMGDEIAELKSERARIIAATVEMCARPCDIRTITPEQVLAQLALNANKEQGK